uniref:Pentapeptide repeat-containing protein n=1 Tax=Candidatus Kentrum sp. LFY TaxID=2126342 RepID=A0A450UAS2_9GAMM|nr:MAG: Pentapeptide repeat-containing protein [Candidatus Kentron sp. LFY]
MLGITGVLIPARRIDMKVGDMPVLQQLAEGIGGLETIELADSLDGQDIRGIQFLEFAVQIFILFVEILFIGDGESLAMLEVQKMTGRSITTTLVLQDLPLDDRTIPVHSDLEMVRDQSIHLRNGHSELYPYQDRLVLLSPRHHLAKLRGAGQHLQVLPYFTPKGERHAYHDPEGLLAKDRRHEWWRKYGAASGKGFQGLPAELDRDNLMDITRQPLLNYLVALSHGRGKLDFGETNTLNEIYADLLAAVHERQWEGGRRHAGSGDLEEDQFVRILEEIALAIWHGDGRTTTVDAIRARCERGRLTKYLEQFTEGAKQGVTRLLTAFYFRQAGDIRGERTFEFTHKSFGEYLTARRLVRALARIETMSARHDEDPDDGWDERDALQHWAEITGPTAMDEYLYEFVQREVALRGEKQCRAWQGTLCRLIAWASHPEKGMPMERLGLGSFAEMLRQSRNAEEALLALHSACADQTKDVMEIHWHSPTAFGAWFKRLQGQGDGSQNTLAQSCLNYLRLAGCRLDFMNLYEAQLAGADLRRAGLFGAILWYAQCHGADLRGAGLGGVDLSRTNLRGADLSEANLIGAGLGGVDLSRTNLSGANLRGANLRGANLAYTRLTNADLEDADLEGVDLRAAQNLCKPKNLHKARNLDSKLFEALR